MGADFGQRAAEILLELLGHFATHARSPCGTEQLADIVKRLNNAMRGFVKNQRRLEHAERLDTRAAGARLRGQKAFKQEAIRGNAGNA